MKIEESEEREINESNGREKKKKRIECKKRKMILTPSLARSCMQGHRPRAAIGRGDPPLAPGPCMTSLSI